MASSGLISFQFVSQVASIRSRYRNQRKSLSILPIRYACLYLAGSQYPIGSQISRCKCMCVCVLLLSLRSNSKPLNYTFGCRLRMCFDLVLFVVALFQRVSFLLFLFSWVLRTVTVVLVPLRLLTQCGGDGNVLPLAMILLTRTIRQLVLWQQRSQQQNS